MKSFFLALFCSFAMQARQPVTQLPRIQVWVLNVAQVPARTLVQAQEIASHVFRSAGIEVVWVDCLAGDHLCRREPGATDFWLHILAHRPSMLEPDTAGYALLVPGCPAGCGYAAASYPAIRAIASELRADPAHLLGATIAHELGHLLLGPNSHDREGVMSPRLGRLQVAQAARGELFFGGPQAQKIRAKAGDLKPR